MSAPNREVFKNFPVDTTLNGAISDTDTAIVVTDGSVFPSTGNFRVLVGSEIMHCTARSTNTLTVNRGVEGTTAAAHSNGANIVHILSQDGLYRAGQDNVPLWGCSSRLPFGKIVDSTGAIITSSSFGIVNQNSTVISDLEGTICLEKPAQVASTQNTTLLTRSVSGDFTQIMAFDYMAFGSGGSDNSLFGLVPRDSSTGKFVYFGIEELITGGRLSRRVSGYNFTNATSYAGSSAFTAFECRIPSILWLKLAVSGTTMTFHFSHDGIKWTLISSGLKDAFVATIDQVAIAIDNRSTNWPVTMRVLHWSRA